VDVGHKGQLKTDVSREVTGVNLLNGSNSTVPMPLTGKGVTVCVVDVGIDFNHPAFKDEQGRSRIKCVYNTRSDKGRKFSYDDPVAGPIEFPGSVFDTPELISKLVYDTGLSPHGAHTTGIAAGSMSPQGFSGMAPDADIVYVAMATLFTEDDVNTGTGNMEEDDTQGDPNPQDLDTTCQLVEQFLAFADAYAQQSDQPMVVSCSLGYHLGPHDGTGAVPEAISALSKHAIPVFSCGNEGGTPLHVQYQFADDKPSFSIGLSPSFGNPDFVDPDPENPFLWAFNTGVKGYTDPGQGGEIGVSLNVVGRDNNLSIVDYVWSSPVVKTTVGDPDQVVMINTADYPEVEKYCRGKVYVATHTRANGQLELTIIPKVFCKEQKNVASYALTLSVSGSPGTEINLWNSSMKFMSYKGEDYIEGDDLMSGSDWSSTPDVISVGAWCANTTMRANEQGKEDEDNSQKYTLGDIAYFSSYGTMPNGVAQPVVCAPGVDVVSAGNQYNDTFSLNGTPVPKPNYIESMTWQGYPYTCLSGTSMACPTVSGIIALWLEANPKLTLADVKDVLANSCDNDEFTAKNPIRWGYGKINAKKGLDYIQDQVTGIVLMSDGRSMMEDVWYTLDGRRLMGQPTQRGIYINKGKKFIVK
jgi:subtilisin family serine protease